MSLRLASLATCCRVLLRLTGTWTSSYWLFDESDVGAVLRAELVRSLLERVEPVGVEVWCGVLFWEPMYLM